MVFPSQISQFPLIVYTVSCLPILNQHAAAAFIEFDPTFRENTTLLTPDQDQNGAKQGGGSELQKSWYCLDSVVQCVGLGSFFFLGYRLNPDLHSFPTRR